MTTGSSIRAVICRVVYIFFDDVSFSIIYRSAMIFLITRAVLRLV